MIIKDIEKLREKSTKVASLDEAKEILSMLDTELTLINTNRILGIGLAAPQIGINKQVAIIRIGSMKIDLVNCQIVKSYDKTDMSEGCLSLPGKTCLVERFNEILIDDNEFGSMKKFVAYGIFSQAIQHEIDHWFGELMIDKSIERHSNVGSNMACPCGSGKKYKKCCAKNK